MLSRIIKKENYYGWVIVACCTIITAIFVGTRLSFGVFFKSLAGEFQLTRLATSSISSAYLILSALFAVVSGLALDKYGPKVVLLSMSLFTGISLLLSSQASSLWQLYFSYSLLLALGTGGSIPVITSTVSRWFYQKRGFALGLANSGGSIGTIAIAPFAAYLIVNLDWRASCLIMGLIALAINIPAWAFLKNAPNSTNTLPSSEKTNSNESVINGTRISQQESYSFLKALRLRSFWFLFIIMFFTAINLFLVFTHLVPYATDKGMSPLEAATLLSIISGSCVVARIISGRVSDYTDRRIPLAISFLLQAVVLIYSIFLRDSWMFYTFAVVFGLSWGGTGVMLPLASDVFSGRNLGLIMGALEVGFLIGAAVGPALGGYVFDISNNYTLAWAIGAAITIAAAILSAFITSQRAR